MPEPLDAVVNLMIPVIQQYAEFGPTTTAVMLAVALRDGGFDVMRPASSAPADAEGRVEGENPSKPESRPPMSVPDDSIPPEQARAFDMGFEAGMKTPRCRVSGSAHDFPESSAGLEPCTLCGEQPLVSDDVPTAEAVWSCGSCDWEGTGPMWVNTGGRIDYDTAYCPKCERAAFLAKPTDDAPPEPSFVDKLMDEQMKRWDERHPPEVPPKHSANCTRSPEGECMSMHCPTCGEIWHGGGPCPAVGDVSAGPEWTFEFNENHAERATHIPGTFRCRGQRVALIGTDHIDAMLHGLNAGVDSAESTAIRLLKEMHDLVVDVAAEGDLAGRRWTHDPSKCQTCLFLASHDRASGGQS